MAWVRIDDHFPQHPKVAAAGPLAMAMQLAGLCYCNRELTDGFVPRAIARTLLDWQVEREDGRIFTIAVTSGMVGDDLTSQWVIDLLVEAGMWAEVPGGYRIHDYLDYQPSRREVEQERERKAAAGRAGGRASAAARRQADAEAGAQAPAQADASADAQADAQQNPTPKPNPVSQTQSRTRKPPPYPPEGGDGGADPTDEQGEDDDDEITESTGRRSPLNRRFEAFWTAYPNKTGKQAAWRAWQRLKPDAERADAMLAAIAAQRQSERWQRDGGRYIPNPATWLNQGRWEDEVGPPARAAPAPPRPAAGDEREEFDFFRGIDEWRPENRGRPPQRGPDGTARSEGCGTA